MTISGEMSVIIADDLRYMGMTVKEVGEPGVIFRFITLSPVNR